MTILEATRQALQALQAGDLKALSHAVDARKQAMTSGEAPTEEAVRLGDQLLAGLRDLQRQAAYESARLGQIRGYLEVRR